LQDFHLIEKLQHFNRERIPERVVHAKGAGAFGTFTVTHDISTFTTARLFDAIGKRTETFVRFSTVGGERGSADTERDPRGFAVRFYTEDGNWDLAGNNTPIFFIKDPMKFPDFVHTQKRDPQTNLKSPTMMWDFWSRAPESLHQVTMLFSDRGTPDETATWMASAATRSALPTRAASGRGSSGTSRTSREFAIYSRRTRCGSRARIPTKRSVICSRRSTAVTFRAGTSST